MNDDRLEQALREMAERPAISPPDPRPVLAGVRQARRRRRVTSGALAAAAVVAVVIGAFLVVDGPPSGRGQPDPAAPPSPSPSRPVETRTPDAASFCEGRSVTFGVSEEIGAPTPTAAAREFSTSAEELRVVRAERGPPLVVVSSETGAPRLILAFERGAGAFVTATTACGDMVAEGGPTCGEAVDFGGHRYELAGGRGPGYTDLGVGRILGRATVPACAAHTSGGVQVRAPVAVRPVTVYGANEQPASEALTMNVDDRVRLFLPVN